MATSITSLVLDIAAKEAIRAARTKLAPLGLFAHSFAQSTSEVGDTVKVPVFSRQAAAEFASGSNDYTSASAAGIAGKSIALNKHPWSARRLLPDDVMETDAGRDWASQTAICSVESVAKYMADIVLLDGILKGIGTETLTISGSTTLKKIANMRTSAIAAGVNPAEATLLLPAGLYSDLLAELPFNALGVQDALVDGYVDRLFGFARIAELQDAVGYENGSGKDVTLDAAIVQNDAIGLATRLPIVQNPDLYEVSTLSVPEVGPWSFQLRSTGSNANDAKYLGAEIIFGFQLLQPGKILVASTTEA